MLELLLALADENDHDKVEYLAKNFYDDLLIYAAMKLQLTPIVGYGPDDAVQETYVRIIYKIDYIDFTRPDYEIKKYMKQILCHIIADRRKYNPDDVLIGDIKTQISSPDDFVQRIMAEHAKGAVIEALKQLDDRYRVPLVLRYCKDYSVKRIAELMNKPIKTVYTNIERGLILLKKYLEEGGWGNE